MYPPALKAAFESLPLSHQQLLRRTAKRIERFASAQRSAIKEVRVPIPGGEVRNGLAPEMLRKGEGEGKGDEREKMRDEVKALCRACFMSLIDMLTFLFFSFLFPSPHEVGRSRASSG